MTSFSLKWHLLQGSSNLFQPVVLVVFCAVFMSLPCPVHSESIGDSFDNIYKLLSWKQFTTKVTKFALIFGVYEPGRLFFPSLLKVQEVQEARVQGLLEVHRGIGLQLTATWKDCLPISSISVAGYGGKRKKGTREEKANTNLYCQYTITLDQ